MKRYTLLLLILLFLLSGCGRGENPYQVDTVVRIPVNPTEITAVAAPARPEETAAPTEMNVETEAPAEATQPAETAAPTEAKPESTGKKPTGTKKPASETGKPPKATGPAVTQPPETVPETQPPTEVPETQPPFDPASYSVGSLEYEILNELNTRRTGEGLGELSMDTRLSGIAALRAVECSVVWGVDRPDGSSYTTAMSDYGYTFGESAQLLGHVGSIGGAADIVGKWMTTGRDGDILNEGFTAAGIGLCRTRGVTIVAVLLVG